MFEGPAFARLRAFPVAKMLLQQCGELTRLHRPHKHHFAHGGATETGPELPQLFARGVAHQLFRLFQLPCFARVARRIA